jgi:ribonuclease VapC
VADTSAIVAVLQREEGAPALRAEIARAGRVLVSAVSAVELTAVASRDETLFETVRDFLNEPFVVVEAVDPEQAAIAADAYRRFGKGRHPAGLNLGDVFSYALARRRDLPLLFTGGDFSRTDVWSATSS